MLLQLTLEAERTSSILPANYQYPLSAAIYRIVEKADSNYASFLHDIGYRQDGSLKTFKLFCFSDIKTPFKNVGDRLQLLTRQAELLVSFQLPKAAETFISGLFREQQLVIADALSYIAFSVKQVRVLSPGLPPTAKAELLLEPRSPVVSGIKNEKGQYIYLSPGDENFAKQLRYNWKEKCITVFGWEAAEAYFQEASLDVIFFPDPPKSRLIAIKAGTAAATKIRGFVKFRLLARGPVPALELLLNAGAGIYNSLGMGFLQVISSVHQTPTHGSIQNGKAASATYDAK